LELDELTQWFNQLQDEKSTFLLPLDSVQNARVIVTTHIDDKIAGIAGLRVTKFLPIVFIVVKKNFQEKGVGTKLLKHLHDRIAGLYNYSVLSVHKDNVKAISIFKKEGYSKFLRWKQVLFMIKTFSWKGSAIRRLLLLNPMRLIYR
jgi:ribosomal protein S18 acetylase RimI-like enzyme